MCVYWLNYYILFIVNWIDWITCWCWEFDELKLIMWLLCELLFKSDELKVNLMNCLRLIDLLIIWLNCVCCWEWCEIEIQWDEKWDEDWDIDDERLNWAIENVDLRFWWFGLICWVMWIACVWW